MYQYMYLYVTYTSICALSPKTWKHWCSPWLGRPTCFSHTQVATLAALSTEIFWLKKSDTCLSTFWHYQSMNENRNYEIMNDACLLLLKPFLGLWRLRYPPYGYGHPASPGYLLETFFFHICHVFWIYFYHISQLCGFGTWWNSIK